MDGTASWLGFNSANGANAAKLRYAVNLADESDLFRNLCATFNGSIAASIQTTSMLTSSMESGIFNCYSSTIIIADALTRLGKGVTIVRPPSHMLLRGSSCAFETTVKNPERAVSGADVLYSKYLYWNEFGSDSLLYDAYLWPISTLILSGQDARAIEYCIEATKLDAGRYEVVTQLGMMHFKNGRYEEAIDFLNRAIEVNAKFDFAWNQMAIAELCLGRVDAAIEHFLNAKIVHNDKHNEWYSRGVSFTALGRSEDIRGMHESAVNNYEIALECYNQAICAGHDVFEAWSRRTETLGYMGATEELRKDQEVVSRMKEMLQTQRRN